MGRWLGSSTRVRETGWGNQPSAEDQFTSLSSVFMMNSPPGALHGWAASVSVQVLPPSNIGKEGK